MIRLHRAVALIGAVALTGAAGLASQGLLPAGAAAPMYGAVGCANSMSSNDIAFPTTAGHISGPQVTPPGALSLVAPTASVLCGAVLQDNVLAFNYIAHGSLTYTVTGPAVINESGTASKSIDCGVAGPPIISAESCEGAVALPGGKVAAPAGLTIHVSLQPGASFSLIGSATPTITVGASFFKSDAPTSTYSVAGTNIGLLLPAYSGQLTPSPATIPAAFNSNTPSTLTFNLAHAAGSACVPLSGVLICGPTPPGTIAVIPGGESGSVTFQTTSGVFQNQAQTFSVHCGSGAGLPLPLSLSACTSVTAQLLGGGAAGTAIVTANFIGDVTGAAAQAETTVNLSPTAATASLSNGCNQVLTPASLAAGTSPATLAGMIQPSDAVTSIWVFDNGSHTWQAAYFSSSGAPTNGPTSVGPNQSLLVCVSGSATFPQ